MNKKTLKPPPNSENRDKSPDKKTFDIQNYICKICGKILEDPYQTQCGCRYCCKCLEKTESKVCLKCGLNFDPKDKNPDRAYLKEMKNTKIKCEKNKCAWYNSLLLYRNHLEEHNKKCLICTTEFSDDEAYLNHQKICCTYCPFGFKDFNKCKLNEKETFDEHMKINISNHLLMLMQYFNHRTSNIEKGINQINSLKSNVTQDSKAVAKKEVSNLPSQINENKTPLNSLIETNLNNLFHDFEDLVKNYETVSAKLREYIKKHDNLKEDLDESKKTLTTAQSTIIQLEENILNLKYATYNGTFVFKITNVTDKSQEAKSGRQTSIYSPPFYTSEYGFKMCARVFLNGDGMGRNTHLSLFFVVMRGEYDSLLKWPFRQKVTFMILDQSTNESREDIIDAFRPDPNSDSFKKPTSDMNTASGIPKFCFLSKLKSTDHEYLKDDCMFIKIIVDNRDLIDV